LAQRREQIGKAAHPHLDRDRGKQHAHQPGVHVEPGGAERLGHAIGDVRRQQQPPSLRG
jgi:hypothetical protein